MHSCYRRSQGWPRNEPARGQGGTTPTEDNRVDLQSVGMLSQTIPKVDMIRKSWNSLEGLVREWAEAIRGLPQAT
jgi:hypothetical protein